MKSNYGCYYSTQISLRNHHWRNSELLSNKFLSVTFLNRVSLELDSELDAAKEFRECRRMGKNCFPRILLGSKRKGKLVPGWPFWFRIAFTQWLGHFIPRYLKRVWMGLTDWRQRAKNTTDYRQNEKKITDYRHGPPLSIFVFRKKRSEEHFVFFLQPVAKELRHSPE